VAGRRWIASASCPAGYAWGFRRSTATPTRPTLPQCTIATAAHPRLTPSLSTPIHLADLSRPRGSRPDPGSHPPTARATPPPHSHLRCGASTRCRLHLRPVLLSRYARLQSEPPWRYFVIMSILLREPLWSSFFVRRAAHTSPSPCERHGPVHLYSQAELPPPPALSPPLPLLARINACVPICPSCFSAKSSITGIIRSSRTRSGRVCATTSSSGSGLSSMSARARRRRHRPAGAHPQRRPVVSDRSRCRWTTRRMMPCWPICRRDGTEAGGARFTR
jgi:hypothetical protein